MTEIIQDNISNITPEEFQTLKSKTELTHFEQAQINKFLFQLSTLQIPNVSKQAKREVRPKQRQSTVEFWRKHKEECKDIKSIKEVFSKYKQYCIDNQLLVLNEFIFRTYIRKNGYNNSGEKKKKKKKVVE